MWVMANNYTDWNENCDEFSGREIISVYSTKKKANEGFWNYILQGYISDLRACCDSVNFHEHRAKYRIAYDRENDILYGGLTNYESITFICEVEDGKDLRDTMSWGLQVYPYENDWKKYDSPTNRYEWEQYWINEEDY